MSSNANVFSCVSCFKREATRGWRVRASVRRFDRDSNAAVPGTIPGWKPSFPSPVPSWFDPIANVPSWISSSSSSGWMHVDPYETVHRVRVGRPAGSRCCIERSFFHFFRSRTVRPRRPRRIRTRWIPSKLHTARECDPNANLFASTLGELLPSCLHRFLSRFW